MSSFDKTVKLACKPKAAPPKAKYIDPIIAATYSEDGAIHDVCKALSPRLREPNAIVVFKALIVLHTMIRNGATDNVLSYLSSEDVLKLRGVNNAHWDGYEAPRNLQNYATYLDTRIRTYKDLKHDPIRVQSESNRDVRVESAVGAPKLSNGPQRSKTIMGRKLRSMTVEKGLLRETKAVQRTMIALLECRFYQDSLEEELNITALRMLVKDLIILFQALNEGVINVLEHYFEMSHVDAESALTIYRNFCKQTEKVVEFLTIARKLQNLLNVPIPNLKHAPVSLVTALEEYLNDPNFEQNRIEYKTTKELADKNAKEGRSLAKRSNNASPAPTKSSDPQPSSSSNPPPKENQALVDFFSSIEGEQTNMFASQGNIQVVPQQQPFQQMQQPTVNPFVARQSMMMTGAFPQQTLVAQPTGFIQPQHTAFPSMPFQNQGIQPMPTGMGQSQHPQFSSFLQPQVPQQTGFLQPQATGVNPFRQSMLLPQTTGMSAFNTGLLPNSNQSFGSSANFAIPQPTGAPQNMQATPFGAPSMANVASSPPANMSLNTPSQSIPQRPASTPLAGSGNAFGAAKPVVSHQTGSRNPFGVPQESPPPVPKVPTLQELSFGKPFGNFGTQPSTQSPLAQQGLPGTSTSPFGALSQATSTSSDTSGMSNIASSFTFGNNLSSDSSQSNAGPTGTSSLIPQFTSTSAFSSQPTGASTATSTFSSAFSSITASSASSVPSLQPQTTGFSGLKPFKPTSSFGASLLESLPPIPQSGATTPNEQPSAAATQPTGSGFNFSGLGASPAASSTGATGPSFGSLGLPSTTSTTPSFGGLSSPAIGATSTPSGIGALNSQPTGIGGLSNFGSSLGVGLRPQMTGGGAANPFRASMFSTSSPSFGGPVPSLPTTQFSSGLNTNPTGFTPSGANLFQSSVADPSKQQQQHNGVASLI